jgi:hypothetical protein
MTSLPSRQQHGCGVDGSERPPKDAASPLLEIILKMTPNGEQKGRDAAPWISPSSAPQTREAWLASAAEAGGQGQKIGIAQPYT